MPIEIIYLPSAVLHDAKRNKPYLEVHCCNDGSSSTKIQLTTWILILILVHILWMVERFGNQKFQLCFGKIG